MQEHLISMPDSFSAFPFKLLPLPRWQIQYLQIKFTLLLWDGMQADFIRRQNLKLMHIHLHWELPEMPRWAASAETYFIRYYFDMIVIFRWFPQTLAIYLCAPATCLSSSPALLPYKCLFLIYFAFISLPLYTATNAQATYYWATIYWCHYWNAHTASQISEFSHAFPSKCYVMLPPRKVRKYMLSLSRPQQCRKLLSPAKTLYRYYTIT